jgi:hypothetical protein
MFQEPEESAPQPSAVGDDGEIDIDAYLDYAIQQRMAPVMPLMDATVKERGEKEMVRIFDEVQAELKTDFDRKLAERVATSFLAEHNGDPVEATKAGARYAAEIRKAERAAGETGYKERLARGPQDYEPAANGAGVRTRPPAKSYDEVTARWAGETEA